LLESTSAKTSFLKKILQADPPLPDHAILEKIRAKTAEIYECTSTAPPSFSSLLAGDAGVQLYNFMYLKRERSPRSEEFQGRIQALAENAFSCTLPTFCSGIAGIDWFLNYLWRERILSTEDKDLLCYRNDELRAQSLYMLKKGNYDFLHGAIGIAYHLLYSCGCGHDPWFPRFFFLLRTLINTSVKKDSIPFYDCITEKVNSQSTNLGLAHGIPAILKFCLQCWNQKICIAEAWELARHIIAYLLTHTNEDRTAGYFPYAISPEQPATAPSRLAWCYGDPGVGYVLYRAGIGFNDAGLTAWSVDLLLDSAKRKNLSDAGVSDAGVSDAGICHGSAGLAHIYNKMWRHTNNPVFKQTGDYWARRTLDFAVYKDGIAGYKRFDPTDNTHHNDYGMLDGVAGIGLVLLGYLTGDQDWDYCLMLND
jgi:lantibiotic modifying enzyme